MAVQAKAKSVRISPRKANVVAALVRGRTVSDALIILEHTPRKAAKLISKVIKSARANATHNLNFKDESLMISEITIDPGAALKRYRPVAFGRAAPFKHRTSHIRVVVVGEQASKKSETSTSPKPAKQTNKSSKEKK